MTLRLRLTLFYVLLLGLVLGGLGLFLRYALRSALYGAWTPRSWTPSSSPAPW